MGKTWLGAACCDRVFTKKTQEGISMIVGSLDLNGCDERWQSLSGSGRLEDGQAGRVSLWFVSSPGFGGRQEGITPMGFKRGRQIGDNILFAQEVVQHYHSSSRYPKCTIKIDITKLLIL